MNQKELRKVLQQRFETHLHRHSQVSWNDVEVLLTDDILKVVEKMEQTGGEPDVIQYGDYLYFVDFAKESPVQRRNLAYDKKAEDQRKKDKAQPQGNVLDRAREIGVELLDVDTYAFMQSLEDIDLKTSSWLLTPEKIRTLGGAIFGDKRYDTVFTYHNGAKSFYASRGFRGRRKLSSDS